MKTLDNINVNTDILILNDNNIISTADNLIQQWDLRTDKIVRSANPVQNIIEKIICDKEKSRLFVVAAEKFVKVLDLENFKNLFSIKFEKEISAFAINKEMDRYGVGFIDGEIAIKGRSYVEDEEGEDLTKEQEDKDIELLE